jgi:ATP-dependent helicase HrpA
MGVQAGGAVGYHVRFDETYGDETSIKFMTDGILLAESQRDRLWLQYDALIIDEAHERSLNIDFILGCLRTLLPRRPDLRVLISSATLDAARFAEFFGDAPIVQVEGRRFPVEDLYLPPLRDDEETAQHILRAVNWISEVDPAGDILVFLPGEREIHDAADLLGGRDLSRTEVLPLYARLSMNEQRRVFQVGGRRRIILATNVAETSITIPGIHYVIDTGLARVKRYNPRLQFERLQIEQISRASADQRRGRCGRIADGICVRLYDRETYDESEAFTAPEIQRTSLEDVILHMKIMRMPGIEEFPFIDPPRTPLIREGYRTLIEIGALDEAQELTSLGREIGRFQVDPRIARMMIEAHRLHVLDEVVVIAAALSIQDPREQPAGDQREAAAAAQSEWKDARSDFMTLLALWNDLENRRAGGMSRGALRRFCKARFLHFRRVQEWSNLVRELHDTISELGWKKAGRKRWKQEEHYRRIHSALLAGIPMQVGQKNEREPGYQGTVGRSFRIFPGSSLFGSSPEWVMAFELVETSRLYARKAAVISPEWVEEVAPHVCKASYTAPSWDARRGFVCAEKSLLCGGLTLVAGKRVHYGPVDPVRARELFIRQGLIPAAMRVRGRWYANYRALLEQVRRLETRIRRPESLLDYHGLCDFFDARLPPDVCSARDFEKWIQRHAEKVPLRLEDMLMQGGGGISPDDYPDELMIEGLPFALEYRFDLGEPEDGLCLVCPVKYAYLVTEPVLDWMVPGWLAQKIHLLLKTVTKRIRRQLVPLPTTADRLAADLLCDEKARQYTLAQVLADRLRRELGEIVGAGDFEPERLPAWLHMRLRIVAEGGKTLIVTRSLDAARAAADAHGGEKPESHAPTEAPQPVIQEAVDAPREDELDEPALQSLVEQLQHDLSSQSRFLNKRGRKHKG